MIWRSLWALIHPKRAAAAIRASDHPDYGRLIPTLMAGGLFFILLHTRFVIGHWVWELGYWPLILVQFMLVGVWVWLIGVMVFVVTFALFAPRRPPIVEIELGVVYLWMSFCIMPVFDVVHLFGVPTMRLTERLHWQHFLLGHFSLLLTSPVRMILVYFLLRELGEVPRGRAWLLAFVLSFGARFVIEPSGGAWFSVTSRLGITPQFWIGQFVLVVASFVVLLLWWWWLWTGSWRRTLAAVTPIASALLVVSVAVWQLSWSGWLPGNRPAPRKLAPVPLSMLPVQLTVDGPRWDRPKSNDSTSASLAEGGDFLDGLDHELSLVMPLEGVSGAIIERVHILECGARVTARDGRSRDGLPWVRCDLVDGAGRFRLAGVPLRNATGMIQYRTRWDAGDPSWVGAIKALGAGTVHVELVLGVHGGGDYTDPDHVKIIGVAVAGGQLSRNQAGNAADPHAPAGISVIMDDKTASPEATKCGSSSPAAITW